MLVDLTAIQIRTIHALILSSSVPGVTERRHSDWMSNSFKNELVLKLQSALETDEEKNKDSAN